MRKFFPVLMFFFVMYCGNPSSTVQSAPLEGWWALVMREGKDSTGSPYKQPYEHPPEIMNFRGDSLTIWTLTTVDTSARSTTYHLNGFTLMADDNGQSLGNFKINGDSLTLTTSIGGTPYSIYRYVRYAGPLPNRTISTDPYEVYRQQVVDKVNQYRATLSLPPLVRAGHSRDSCSDAQAKYDGDRNTAHGAFGKCGESAQNECPNYTTLSAICATCLPMMWAEGPGEPYAEHGHYLNMTNTTYKKIAVGFGKTTSGKIWSVTNFYP